MNIIVTTPKKEIENAAKEAGFVIKNKGGFYFRRLATNPTKLEVGDKVFYVEDGYIRGFALVFNIEYKDCEICDVTDRIYDAGWYVEMNAATWKWINPIPMKGFQGWRYFNSAFEIIGGWLDKKPLVKSL